MRLFPALSTLRPWGLVFALAAFGCAQSGAVSEAGGWPDAAYITIPDSGSDTDSKKDSSTATNDSGPAFDSSVSSCTRDFSVKTASDMILMSSCATVTGNLTVESPTLTDVMGLSAVKSINGDLNIWGNAALTDISGLSNLTSVTGGLAIRDNDVLEELKGLGGVTFVGGSLVIGHNKALGDLNGLAGLNSVGALYVYDNAELGDMTGINKLASVKGEFRIENNPSLPTCQADALKKALVAKGYSGTATIAGNDDEATCQ